MAKGRGNKIGRTMRGTSRRGMGRNTAPGMTTRYYKNPRTGVTTVSVGGTRVKVGSNGRVIAPRSNTQSGGNRSVWQRIGDFILGRR